MSGSLMPIAKYSSPRAMPGTKRSFCSSVPHLRMLGAICRSAIQCAATGAPAASSSSVTAKRSSALAPRPPYCSG